MPQINRLLPWQFSTLCILLILGLVGCQPAEKKARVDGTNAADAANAMVVANESKIAARQAKLADLPAIKGQPFQTNQNQTGQFTEINAADSGIDYFNEWNVDDQNSAAFGTSFIAHGVTIGDYDADGRPDVYVTGQKDGGRLYRNLGDLKFEDVTEKVGIDPADMWSVGAAFVDLNGDGLLDIYVYGYGCPNRLYINKGSHFSEQAEERGLDYNGASVCAAYADYDLDGDLDVYLVTNRLDTKRQDAMPNESVTFRDSAGRVTLNPNFRESFYLMQHPDKGTIHEPGGEFDHLFRNDGDKFTDVSRETKIGEVAHLGLSANWWDYNDDGLPDLYVANDFKGADLLYRNNGKNHLGEYTFTNVMVDSIPHSPWFSMGSDISDVNNDGRMDYFATDMAGTNHYRDKLSMGGMSGPDSTAWFLNWPTPPQYVRNCLFLNSGTDRFMEVAFLAGLAKTDWTWTVKFDDFDNDGWEDVYFTNGMSRDWYNGDYKDEIRLKQLNKKEQTQFWIDKPVYALENRAYRNTGDLEFEDVSQAWGLDHSGVSTGAASGDLDGDGDLDLVVNGFNEPIRVYRNDVNAGNSIQFQLLGGTSNAQGIGARIDVTVDEASGSQMRWLAAGRGFMSSSEVVAHFGTGDATSISKATIRWPSGITQTFEDLKCNERYVVTEKGAVPAALASTGKTKTLFEESSALDAFKHNEILYDDFKREPLLPNKHSQLGPGMAWADINNDGRMDVYMGQAAGGPGRLLIDNGNGKFEINPQAVFNKDSNCEDMGAAFFDADGDGDMDLYVASGGVESDPGAETLRDRLYLNDGSGVFEDAQDRLPDLRNSSSVVAPADFDRDGDVDLFIGSRLNVGAYPTTPNSTLLLNEDGKFVEATDDVAPGLKDAGMVTSAIWSDANDDGWLDLIVTEDWGPVRLWLSDNGSLSDVSEQSGLANRLGWFNSVSAGDIDNDGDMDYVVGNCGLNTKYSATTKKPELIYFGDFENNGKLQIVEAKFEDGKCLPRRGLGCTSDAMPTIKEKLPTYHDFAISELVEIYSQNGLEDADKFEVNNLDSGVLINQGGEGVPTFEFRKLPRVVQASPVFGSTLTDVNADGFLDLYVVQNFHGPQRETGNFDGGVSLLLLGDGSGDFAPVWPDQSGLVVGKDGGALTVTDLDGDARPDFVVSVNNRQPKVFQNQMDGDFVRVQLQPLDRIPSLVGTRVSFTLADGKTLTRSIDGGGSYLSQSPQEIFVAGKIQSAKVRWPDGSETTHQDINPVDGVISLSQTP